jgi:hypothetical protein
MKGNFQTKKFLEAEKRQLQGDYNPGGKRLKSATR